MSSSVAAGDVAGTLSAGSGSNAELAAARAISSLSPRLREERLRPVIEKIALSDGVSPHLVRAVIRIESNFDPLAVSSAGAKGLMQLMPLTAKFFGVKDIFDVEQNIRGGVRFLKHLQGRYGKKLHLVLAAYHAGEPRVEAAGTVPNIPATRRYVYLVITQYYRLLGRKISPTIDLRLRAALMQPTAARASHSASGKRPIRIYRNPAGTVVITNVD